MTKNREETETEAALRTFAIARREFENRVAGVNVAQFGDPTPCDDWTVRDLIDHVMAGDIFATRVLAGATIEEAVEGLLGVDLVGADPLPALRSGADAVADGFARPGALDSIVHHPVGDITGATFLEFRTMDYTGHAWDLARATGLDEALDPELVQRVWAITQEQHEMLTTSDDFGGDNKGDDSGDDSEARAFPLQDRLLIALGRPPSLTL